MTLYLTYTTWKRKKYRIAAYTVSQRISLSEHKWVNLSERYRLGHYVITFQRW